MTGSWATSGFPIFERMRDEVWNMTQGYLTPSADYPTQEADVAASISLKAKTGAPVSVIDACTACELSGQTTYNLLSTTTRWPNPRIPPCQ